MDREGRCKGTLKNRERKINGKPEREAEVEDDCDDGRWEGRGRGKHGVEIER